jgi:hypothetical protein
LSAADDELAELDFGGGESATAPLDRSGAERLFLLGEGLRKFCKTKTLQGMRFYSSEGLGFVIHKTYKLSVFLYARACHRMQCSKITRLSPTGKQYRTFQQSPYTGHINRIA